MSAGKIPLGPTGELVAANVRQLRTSQRLTYVELYQRLLDAGRPIHYLGLRRIEHGERRVDVDDLVALAAALGVTPTTLLQPHQPHGPIETIEDRLSRLEAAAAVPVATPPRLHPQVARITTHTPSFDDRSTAFDC